MASWALGCSCGWLDSGLWGLPWQEAHLTASFRTLAGAGNTILKDTGLGLGSVNGVLGFVSDVCHRHRWGNAVCQVSAVLPEQVGNILYSLSLPWAADQELRPVWFPVSWKSVFASLGHVPLYSLREAYSG